MIAPFVVIGLFGGTRDLPQTVTVTPLPVRVPDEETRRRVQVWRRALRDAFLPIGGNVVVDVGVQDLSFDPPRSVSDGVSRDEFLTLMGSLLHRRALPQPEGCVFARSPEYEDSSAARYAALVDWLGRVSNSELRALLGSGVPYAYLSPLTRQLYARLGSDNIGLTKKMANGEFALAQLRLAFAATAQTTSGKDVRLQLDQDSSSWPIEQIRYDRMAKGYVPPRRMTEPPRRVAKGDLDLSSGEILTTQELVDRANEAFGKAVSYDGRLAQSYVYVQGRFTPEAFLRFIKAQGQSTAWSYSPSAAERRFMLDQAVRARVPGLLDATVAPRGVTYGELLEGKTLQASRLAGGFERLDTLLNAYGVSESANLTLSPDLRLQLVSEGSYVDPIEPKSGGIENTWVLTFRMGRT